MVMEEEEEDRVERGTTGVSGYAWNEEETAERPFLLQKCPSSFSFALGCSINSAVGLISYFIKPKSTIQPSIDYSFSNI